jgi:GGDEF domain-containing protein
MTTYFGFALADSMFSSECVIVRTRLDTSDVIARINAGEAIPCLNPSHETTIAAMRQRFGISIEIPETPPRVSLGDHDRVIVMGVRGLPRLTDRHEYTQEEIAQATFLFSEYVVFPTGE